MSATIYGHSDDLIEIEGDIREEFPYSPDDEDEGMVVVLSTGHVFRVLYGNEGIWRITPLAGSAEFYTKVEATDPDGDYTDRVTLHGTVEWVACGNSFERRKRADKRRP